jgi:hypothetical protein
MTTSWFRTNVSYRPRAADCGVAVAVEFRSRLESGRMKVGRTVGVDASARLPQLSGAFALAARRGAADPPLDRGWL